MLELGGWDSHANQAAPQGALSANLRRLDDLLAHLQLPRAAIDRLVLPGSGGMRPLDLLRGTAA